MQPTLLDSATIVSADRYFINDAGEYAFDASMLAEAHNECFREFIEALQDKAELVIVDNTNLSSEEIAPYMLGASAFGYEASVVTIRCNSTEACQRNVHGISWEIISSQVDRLMKRKLIPWWKSSEVDR